MALVDAKNKAINAKLVYYGPGLCGKTTNLQYINEKLLSGEDLMSLATEGDRTIFFDFMPLELGMIRGMKVNFKLYTVPGQVRYNQTRKMVLKNVDGVVFVADSQRAMMDSNLESLENLFDNFAELEINPENVPVILQYNKRDLPTAMSVAELDAHLNKNGYLTFTASAVTGEGVVETLKASCKEVIRRLSASFGEPVQSSNPGAPASAGRARQVTPAPASAPHAGSAAAARPPAATGRDRGALPMGGPPSSPDVTAELSRLMTRRFDHLETLLKARVAPSDPSALKAGIDEMNARMEKLRVDFKPVQLSADRTAAIDGKLKELIASGGVFGHITTRLDDMNKKLGRLDLVTTRSDLDALATRVLKGVPAASGTAVGTGSPSDDKKPLVDGVRDAMTELLDARFKALQQALSTSSAVTPPGSSTGTDKGSGVATVDTGAIRSEIRGTIEKALSAALVPRLEGFAQRVPAKGDLDKLAKALEARASAPSAPAPAPDSNQSAAALAAHFSELKKELAEIARHQAEEAAKRAVEAVEKRNQEVSARVEQELGRMRSGLEEVLAAFRHFSTPAATGAPKVGNGNGSTVHTTSPAAPSHGPAVGDAAPHEEPSNGHLPAEAKSTGEAGSAEATGELSPASESDAQSEDEKITAPGTEAPDEEPAAASKADDEAEPADGPSATEAADENEAAAADGKAQPAADREAQPDAAGDDGGSEERAEASNEEANASDSQASESGASEDGSPQAAQKDAAEASESSESKAQRDPASNGEPDPLADDPEHKNAARVARVMVSDLDLYQKEEVEKGLKEGDFFERNKEALDDMRATYEQRIPEAVRAHKDYLGEAITRFLDKKRAKLGLQ